MYHKLQTTSHIQSQICIRIGQPIVVHVNVVHINVVHIIVVHINVVHTSRIVAR